MRLFFWDAWPAPPTPTGQSPAASRHRGGYRSHYATGAVVLLMVVLGW